MLRIIDRGVAYPSQGSAYRQSCAFPSVSLLPGGRWLCGFREAPQKKPTARQKALVMWSDDEGRTWTDPVDPFIPPEVDGSPGLFRGVHFTALGGSDVLAALCWVDHSDPDLPFFNEETEGLLDTRIFLARSRDRGETWMRPEIVDTSPFNTPTPLTGPTLLLPNGEWACQFELNKPYLDASEWRHAPVLLFSRDEGKSWHDHSVVARDPANRVFYWDQRPGVLPDGRILDLFWPIDRKKMEYLSILARESPDNGRTWS